MIPLLLLTLLVFAMLAGEAWARMPASSPTLASGPQAFPSDVDRAAAADDSADSVGPSMIEERAAAFEERAAAFEGRAAVFEERAAVDDGLVELPSPDRQPAYSEKASAAEMTFAGHYLNLAGVAMLATGVLSYLRVSGLTERASSGGWLQCCLGAALGLFLSWSGDRLFRQGMRGYALPLLTTGLGILAATLGASHFLFHLLPAAGLAVGCFAIVVWGGMAAIRYDAPMIGAGMLAALFVGPSLMRFSFEGLSVVLWYLLAINLAITLVAYHKKWDGFLIASLVGSYWVYFCRFGIEQPWWAIGFLASTYALFLASGNLFHFLRRTASDYDLGLSLVNPLLFACASYPVLWLLPNAAALTIYTSIALIHAALAAVASNLRGQAGAYERIAQANTALAILFATAAVSFLTYCSNDTGYFAVVAFLWLAQGFALYYLSGKMGEHLTTLVRRGSYGAMALASIQLAYVVPTMEQPAFVECAAMLAQLGYFWLHERTARRREERLLSNLVLLGAITSGYHSLPFDLYSMSGFLTLASVSLLALVAYTRYPITLTAYRYVAPALAGATAIAAVCSYWPYSPQSWRMLPLVVLLAALTPMCSLREDLEAQSGLGVLLATGVLLRGCQTIGRHYPLPGLLLAVMTIALLAQIGRRVSRVEPAVQVLGVGLGFLAMIIPAASGADTVALVLTSTIFGLLGLQAWREERWPMTVGASVTAALIAMRIVMSFQAGAGSTLIWCLLGLGLLRANQSFERSALVILFLGFLKSILFDSTFEIGVHGWQMAAGLDPWSLTLACAVIGCFAQAARLSRGQPEVRNYYSLFGLLIFAFYTTSVLFHLYGILDNFQVILSGFWATASLLFVAFGIHAENKLFRLFGLVVLVSCVLKIYAVDIWMLDSYSKTTTTLVLGSLLMIVSFLYQTNRSRLEQPCVA